MTQASPLLFAVRFANVAREKVLTLNMRSLSFISILALFILGCQDESTSPGSNSPPVDLDSRPINLSTPRISLGVGIETGDFSFSWSSSSGATYYTLQSDNVPWFSIPIVVYSGPNQTYYLGFKSNHMISSYYRVRAESQDSRSNWSDTLKFPE